MSWLGTDHGRLASERILAAAAELFAAEGITAPGMEEVARAAGCSRATLYRYFPNRRALVAAFAQREATAILDRFGDAEPTGHSGPAGLVATALHCLAEVRSRTYLERWYSTDGGSELTAVLTSPAVLSRLGPDPDLAEGVIRLVVSLLVTPGADAAAERRVLERLLGRQD
ncbi:TetR/AcrR family transcriptional regulator [Nocardioides sp. BGMRC 2183]|nr:TetR/AcrR family transcriptional regulator [Nocardioides sp. BGMRC 2183]